MTEYMERELGWDDEIEKEGGDFPLLPAGEYNFRVTGFKRGRFDGSDKMPACPRAEIELTIQSPEHGEVTVFESLLLHQKTEWKLSEFFISIGQKKKGEKVKMNWQAVIGSQGRCELEINKYVSKGKERENNRVSKFLEPSAQPQQPAYQQPPAQPNYQPAPAAAQPQQPFPTQQAPFPQQPQGAPQQGGFTPGSF